jgi:bacterioferritin-associated ferredoxin
LIFILITDMLRAMWVCYCNRIRDGAIRRAIRDGACTVRCIARATGAGTTCGGCRPTIAEILSCEVAATAPEPQGASFAALELPAP